MSESAPPQVPLPAEDEVCAYRQRGLHPLVLWLPALGSENFAHETHRQAKELIKANEEEREVMAWVESVSDDVLDNAD